MPLPAAPHMACPEASEGQEGCLLLFLFCLHVLFAVSVLSLRVWRLPVSRLPEPGVLVVPSAQPPSPVTLLAAHEV